jgi:hypothetical protein
MALRLNTSVSLIGYEYFNEVHADTFGPLNGYSESIFKIIYPDRHLIRLPGRANESSMCRSVLVQRPHIITP